MTETVTLVMNTGGMRGRAGILSLVGMTTETEGMIAGARDHEIGQTIGAAGQITEIEATSGVVATTEVQVVIKAMRDRQTLGATKVAKVAVAISHTVVTKETMAIRHLVTKVTTKAMDNKATRDTVGVINITKATVGGTEEAGVFDQDLVRAQTTVPISKLVAQHRTAVHRCSTLPATQQTLHNHRRTGRNIKWHLSSPLIRIYGILF